MQLCTQNGCASQTERQTVLIHSQFRGTPALGPVETILHLWRVSVQSGGLTWI